MPFSSGTPSQLPDIQAVRAVSQSLALLDAVLSPAWEYRHFSFDAHWAAQQSLASMRNGEGDHYFIWFGPQGAVLKGFGHESPMSPYRVDPPQVWPGVLDSLSNDFASFRTQPAFVLEETTFCFWRGFLDSGWQSGTIQFPGGNDPDGSASLLRFLDGNPQTYQQWAEAYYERPVDLSAVVHIYQHRPLTEAIVKALNAGLNLEALASDLAEIGFGPYA
jgi:hypothetical protein